MLSTSRLSETPSGSPTAVVRDGKSMGADFQAALAEAVGAQAAVSADTGGGSRRHVVKAGETLYGIARARLAAAGQAATPGASMRHALEIAKANDIRHPDRIRTGQQLVLGTTVPPQQAASNAATASARNVAPADSVAIGSGIDDAARLRTIREFETQAETPVAVASPDAGEIACDAASCLPDVPRLAAPGRGVGHEGDHSEVKEAVAVPADLSLYTKSMVEAPSKPPAELPDIVYKGVVGKALDLVPLEPSTRTGLQQANAVVSASVAARAIAAATGIGGPIITIAGLVWGIFSAHKISAMQAQTNEPKQVARHDITAGLNE